MSRYSTAIKFSLLLLLLQAAPAIAQDPALREIETLYSAGSFDAASQRVNDLLAQEGTLAVGERARLYLMKARIELAYGRKQEIRLWLTKAREADPQLAPDPVLDPPQLVSVWEAVKKGDDKPSRPVVEPVPPPATGQSVWTMFLPLGGGHFLAGRHKDGGLFLATEALIALAANSVTMADPERDPDGDGRSAPHAREILGGSLLLGAYGYELVDMLAEMELASPAAASGTRAVLSIFPFGVAQAKNGDIGKALTIAALQSTLLTAGVLAPKERHRHASLAAFGAIWLYGMIDGFLGAPESDKARKTSFYPRLTPGPDGSWSIAWELRVSIGAPRRDRG